MNRDDLTSVLSSSDCFVFAKLPLHEDSFSNDFVYLDGRGFEKFGLRGIRNLEDLLDAIDPHCEIVEGVGVAKYRDTLVSSASNAAKQGKEANALLNLVKDGTSVTALMHIIPTRDSLLLIFIRSADLEGIPGANALSAGTFKDRLTGLFNFQTLKKHLKENDKDSLLCLFDLNGFKAINDNFGHSVGDDVLVYITSYLISISTMNEIYYRRSGDEFFIMFLNDDLDHAKDLIDKIEYYIAHLKEYNFQHLKGFECSAAFGLIGLKDKTSGSLLSVEQELQLADLAMYEAKHTKTLLRYIPYEEAVEIVEDGSLEEKLAAAAKKCSR